MTYKHKCDRNCPRQMLLHAGHCHYWNREIDEFGIRCTLYDTPKHRILFLEEKKTKTKTANRRRKKTGKIVLP